jgi:hypothetical protein
METFTKQLTCLTVATLLAACSQGGASLVPQPGQRSPAAATSDARHRVPVRFTFRIPFHPKHHHAPKYISPSTTSLQVLVYNSTHTKKLADVTHTTTPGSNGCTAVKAGTFTCSFSLIAPLGSDRFDVFAIDGFSGAKLSAIVNFPFTVAQSKLNQIKMTLGGIPASLEFSIVGSSVLQTGSSLTGYQLGGIGKGAAQPVQIVTKDADANIIVNPGAPVVTITNSAPTKLSIVPVSGSPGRYTMTPLVETNALPSPNPSTAVNLTITATPQKTGTAPISTIVHVQNDPIVFGHDYYNTQDAVLFAPWSTSPILLLPDPMLTEYSGISIDAAGNVYVCNYTAGTVNVFPPGSSTASRTITGLVEPCYPTSIAVDGTGNIFVPEESLDVKEYSPSSGNTPIRTIPSSYPVVSVDKSGTLYVVNYDTSGVSVYPPGASTTPAFQFNAGMSGPFVTTFDSAGNLYVLNYGGENVTEYKPPFSSSSAVFKTFGSSTYIDDPYGLSVDLTGNVYVASYSTDSVSEFTQAAPLANVRTLGAGSYTLNVGTDQLGNAYVPAYTLDQMIAYPPGTGTTAINAWSLNYVWMEAVWP